jgi:hypothetical protein
MEVRKARLNTTRNRDGGETVTVFDGDAPGR